MANLIGIPHPLWATISALMVPQEKLADTNASFWGYILGTLVGIGAGGMASVAASRFAIDMAGQIALSVGLCAILARVWPSTRVCMWTGPIVLLTAEPALPITHAVLPRFRSSSRRVRRRGLSLGGGNGRSAHCPPSHSENGAVLVKTEQPKAMTISLCYRLRRPDD